MFIGYFSPLAYDLIKWAIEENNTKVLRKADEIEIKYRHNNEIPLDYAIWYYKPYVNEFRYAHLCLKK